MRNFFTERRILVLCVIGIILALILSFTTITSIWKKNLSGAPSENSSNNTTYSNSGIGVFETVNVSDEAQVKKYVAHIAETLELGNFDDIYSMVDPGYLKYFKITKDSLKSRLSSKGVMNIKLNMSGYKKGTIESMNVYSVDYASTDNSITCNINIVEKSPNNYTIAFDDFVTYIEEPREFIRDGLKFTIYDQAWFKSRYVLKAKLENLNEDSYVVNASRLYENCYVKLSNSNEKRTSSSVLSGESVTLNKNDGMNYDLSFDISELGFSSIKSFILKDIRSVSTGIVKNYEFEI